MLIRLQKYNHGQIINHMLTLNMFAQRGHLSLLRLYSNRRGGFAPYLTSAVRSGNLNIVKWFYINNYRKYDDFTLVVAAQKGYLHIIIWFIETFGAKKCYIFKIYYIAIQKGHKNIIDYIDKYYPDLINCI